MAHLKRMYLFGGIAGLLSCFCYALLFTAPLAYVQFPVTASQIQIVLYFWPGPLLAVFGIMNSYALYRILADECQGSLNRLAYLFSILAFGFLAVMMLVQETLRITLSERYTDAAAVVAAVTADASKQDLYHAIYLALDGLDLGIDLGWDLFLSISLVLSGLVMLRHSRFKAWFGLPSLVCGLLLLVLNGITVPFPPNTRGLFDAGPYVGLYSLVLSVYMVVVGAGMRSSAINTHLTSLGE